MNDTADATRTEAPPELLLRDAEDDIDMAFVRAVHDALLASDARRIMELAGDLHEADLGALIEHLVAEDRPKLIALMGRDFDFAALTEVDDAVREEILDELPNEAIAEGVKDLDSDDAVYILEDLTEEDQREVLAQLTVEDRVSLTKSLDYPEGSAGRRMQ
ncbi:MAG: magnesium transporter MgtE N-terminal domain-containing protein, partial [Beijerinckiaceae bacterium]